MADIKIGEISKGLPKGQGERTDLTSTYDGERLKSEVLKGAGIRHHERYEAIADIPLANTPKIFHFPIDSIPKWCIFRSTLEVVTISNI